MKTWKLVIFEFDILNSLTTNKAFLKILLLFSLLKYIRTPRNGLDHKGKKFNERPFSDEQTSSTLSTRFPIEKAGTIHFKFIRDI